MKLLMLILTCFTLSRAVCQVKPAGDTLSSSKTDSVVVVSRKPFIQTLIDKTVMNIEGSPAIAGQNALDLLKSAPGVVVDGNENIQMGGKGGVTVMIDGRNTQLTGQDLAQLLKSIESDNIKEIELITNPSARFDAAGSAGIINIRLKKSMTNGVNGNIAPGYSQSTHARSNITAGLNMRNQQWNWYTNAGINEGLQHTIANNDRITSSKIYTQRGIEKDRFHGANIRTGIDYTINSNNTIGVLWMYNNKYSGMDNINQTNVQQPGYADTNVNNRSIAPFNNNRNNLNLNYHHADKKGSELNVDADYIAFRSDLNNQVSTDMETKNLNKFYTGISQNNAFVNIDIKSLKADYTINTGKNAKLEMGFKTVFTRTDNQLAVVNLLNSQWLLDTGKTNVFHFTENINAAYINYQTKWKKWSLQAGLRAEQSRVKGASEDLKQVQLQKPDTVYTNLFPALFLQYAINAKNQLGINYGKRIDRPSYQDQNPFIYVLDAFNSEQGNPYLIPQITDNIELSYTYRYATTLSIKYSVTKNYIESLTYQSGNNTINTPQNSGQRKMLNINLGSSLSLSKWWNLYAYAEPFYQQYQTFLNGYGLQETIQHSSWGFNSYLNNSFALAKNWKAEISGWYNFQNTTTIYYSKAISSINIGVSKKIIHEKASVKIGITDLLGTQRWEQTAQTNNLNLHTYRKWEGQNINFSFNYRFGNTKIKNARDRKTTAEEELGRIK